MAIRTHIAALTLAALPAFATVPALAGSLAEPEPTPVIAPVIVEVAPRLGRPLCRRPDRLQLGRF